MRRHTSAAVVLLGVSSAACWSARHEPDRTAGAGARVLAWSLPDGHGGANELCRASACLPWLTAAAQGRLAIGDFDGDGAADVAREVDGGIVVAAAHGGGFHELAARRGAAGEQLGAQLLPLGDVDGDGRHDVLALVVDAAPPEGEPVPKVSPRERPPRLALLRGAPDGLAPPRPLASLDGWWSDLRIAAGDLDGDHRPDIALAGMRDGKGATLAGIRGEPGGPGTAISWSFPVRDVPARIAIADLDGDGFGDLLAFGTNRAPSSWSRWPGGPGGPRADHHQTWSDPSGNPQSWFASIAAVGRFGGNAVEVAVAALGARTIYVYRAGSSKPDRVIEGGSSLGFGEAIAAIDLNADGRDELVVFARDEVLVFTGARAEAVLARQPRSP